MPGSRRGEWAAAGGLPLQAQLSPQPSCQNRLKENAGKIAGSWAASATPSNFPRSFVGVEYGLHELRSSPASYASKENHMKCNACGKMNCGCDKGGKCNCAKDCACAKKSPGPR